MSCITIRTQTAGAADRGGFRPEGHPENRRTVRDMGSPTQKMCITNPTIIILKENGCLPIAESGTTMRFMKK
jgi:hypothetical protein